MTKYYISPKGVYLGGFSGSKPKVNHIEVSSPPNHGKDLYDLNTGTWVPHEVPYSEKRKAEYPDIGDQLDAIMKWAATENEITLSPEFKSIAMKCMSVKAKYPKPKELT